MAIFYRLLGFLKPYKRGLIASTLFAAGAMVMTVLLPLLTGRAVEEINAGSRGPGAHDAAKHSQDLKALTTVALIIVAVSLVRWGLAYARRTVAGRVSLGIEYDLRELMYGHLQKLELAFFDRQQTGQLMSRVTVDLQAVRFFLGYGLVFILQSALTILLAAAVMIALNPSLGAIAIAPVPFVVVIANRYGRRARPAVQETQQRIAELTAEAEESISGVRVVKAFARERHQLARFHRSVGRVFDQAMVATRIEATYNPIIAFLPQLGLSAVLLIGGEAVINSHLSLEHFTAFYFLLNMLIAPMRMLGVTLGMAQRATASGARIFQVLDRAPQLTDPADAVSLPAGRGEIELRDVSLAYEAHVDELAVVEGLREADGGGTSNEAPRRAGAPSPRAPGNARPPVLRHVDLHIQAGERVAIVGGTGSGKTSLVSLLPRLYDVTGGALLIDGVDVRKLRASELRRAIAIVGEDPFLFSATVAENIAYGRPDASAEAVQAAAARAQALEFIAELPEGFDTMVGERGLTLSGGQRQRLAIARALLIDPRVLVLDDATSSVDASTEQKIKAAMREAMQDRTTIVIAHRLSTITLAQRIVVLEDGGIAAAGDHRTLLEASPLYREIVQRGSPTAERIFAEEEQEHDLAAGGGAPPQAQEAGRA